MKTVILCGGKGTRIADSNYDAKALVEVSGKPILWHIMKIYSAFGEKDFLLTLGYGGASIKHYFTNYDTANLDFTITFSDKPEVKFHEHHGETGWAISMIDTGLETNKGGRLSRVMDHIGDETFHLTYGDGVGDIDLNALMAFHRSHGKIMTVTGYQPYSQYGILDIDKTDLVVGFKEKPRLDSWINAGFMICEPGIKDYLRPDPSLDLEKEIMVKLANDRQLMVYKHDGFWRSMDTFKEAQELTKIWENEAPWKVWKD